MQQFQEERLWAAAGGLMKMERMIRMTIEYTAGRQAFGKSILDNQVVHFRLAELETKVELFVLLVYRTVEEYLAGADVTQLASMAKLTAGRLVREVSDSCLQYWGGMGYMTESEISRMYRDLALELDRRRRGRDHAASSARAWVRCRAEEEPLARSLLPPLEKGRSVCEANRVGIIFDPHPNPPPFRGRELERPAHANRTPDL